MWSLIAHQIRSGIWGCRVWFQNCAVFYVKEPLAWKANYGAVVIRWLQGIVEKEAQLSAEVSVCYPSKIGTSKGLLNSGGEKVNIRMESVSPLFNLHCEWLHWTRRVLPQQTDLALLLYAGGVCVGNFRSRSDIYVTGVGRVMQGLLHADDSWYVDNVLGPKAGRRYPHSQSSLKCTCFCTRIGKFKLESYGIWTLYVQDCNLSMQNVPGLEHQVNIIWFRRGPNLVQDQSVLSCLVSRRDPILIVWFGQVLWPNGCSVMEPIPTPRLRIQDIFSIPPPPPIE